MRLKTAKRVARGIAARFTTQQRKLLEQRSYPVAVRVDELDGRQFTILQEAATDDGVVSQIVVDVRVIDCLGAETAVEDLKYPISSCYAIAALIYEPSYSVLVTLPGKLFLVTKPGVWFPVPQSK